MKARISLLASLLAVIMSTAYDEHSAAYAQPKKRGSSTTKSQPAANSLFAYFPVGATKYDVLDQSLQVLLHGTSVRDANDQVRDWLLFSIMNASGMPNDRINTIMYNIQSSRLGYMEEIGEFEYGVTRFRSIGKGEVIALIPGEDTGIARLDHLARIADEHRKNTGGIADSILVFEYTYKPGDTIVPLRHMPSVAGKDFYAASSGYVEMPIATLTDLQTFLSQIHDLTYLKMNKGKVIFGGRRMKGGYRGVDVEHVTEIWRAARLMRIRDSTFQRNIDEAERRLKIDYEYSSDSLFRVFRVKMNQLKAEGNKLDRMSLSDDQYQALVGNIIKRIEATKGEYEIAVKELGKAFELRREQLVELFRNAAQGYVAGLGFSLDPKIHCDSLRQFHDLLLSPLLDIYVDEGDRAGESIVRAIKRQVEKCDDSVRKAILNMLVEVAGYGFSALASSVIDTRCSYQHARYDGDLRGTSTGMTLFYCDLLAKLWIINFQNSAPVGQIDSSLSVALSQVSDVFALEAEQLPGTRLWFTMESDGVTKDPGGLLFGRNATRIEARSSDFLGEENTDSLNPKSRVAINFWRRHFDEIATYEPEYQRLNQIMKWCAAIGWLNEHDKKQALRFLGTVPIDTTRWFPAWASARKDLRFTDWNSIGFHSRGYNNEHVETMPVLVSFDTDTIDSLSPFSSRSGVWSGGVELPVKKILSKISAVNRRVGDELRHGNRIIKSESQGVTRITGKKITWKLERARSPLDDASIRIDNTRRNLSKTMELSGGPFKRTIRRDARDLTVELNYRDMPHGRLKIKDRPGGSRIEWEQRDVGIVQGHAEKWSDRAKDLPTWAAETPDVQESIAFGETGLLARFRGMERWGYFKRGSETTAGAHGRAARAVEGHDVVEFSLKTKREVESMLRGEEYIRISAVKGETSCRLMYRSASSVQAEGGFVQVNTGSTSIKFGRDGLSRDLIVKINDLPADLRANPTGLQRQIFAPDFPQITKALDEGTDVILSRTVDPARLKNVDAFLREGNVHAARSELRNLRASHGNLPDIDTRLAVINILHGDKTAAARALSKSGSGGISNKEEWYNALDELLKGENVPLDRVEDVLSLVRFAESNPKGLLNTTIDVVDGQLAFNMQVSTHSIGTPIPFNRNTIIAGDGATVYVPAHLGPNTYTIRGSVIEVGEGVPVGKAFEIRQLRNDEPLALAKPDVVIIDPPTGGAGGASGQYHRFAPSANPLPLRSWQGIRAYYRANSSYLTGRDSSYIYDDSVPSESGSKFIPSGKSGSVPKKILLEAGKTYIVVPVSKNSATKPRKKRK